MKPKSKLPDAVLQDAAEAVGNIVETAAEAAAAVVTDSDGTAQVVRAAAAKTAALVVTSATAKLAEVAATIAATAKAAAASVIADGEAAAQVVQTAAAKAAVVVASASTIATALLAEAKAVGQTDLTTVAEAATIATVQIGAAAKAAAASVIADGEAAAQVVQTAAAKAAAILSTQQDQLEEHLRQTEKLSAVGQLAGGIAHDFNNLITTINGYTEFVLMTLDKSDARREDLLEVSKAGLRAATLTKQLLAFSRQQVLQPRVLDVNALVTGIQALLRRTMSEDIEVVMALGDVTPVRVDASQFDQVLMNLALNARDAMPDGGHLHFVTDSVDVDEAFTREHPPMTLGRYTRVTVRDTGTGMTPETQARIFEPFFTTKPVGKGTGLGLATVYGIVKQSGGFVWVESHVGRGTSFTVYLPVVNAPLEPTPSARASELTVGGSETILLVEDDGAVRRLAKHLLSYRGYHVLDARDGDHGLEVAQQHRGPIHLLLTDVVMPGISGPTLASRLLPTRPEMRVLYTSGYIDGGYIAALRDAPLLAKPFLPGDLLRRVRDVLDATSAS